MIIDTIQTSHISLNNIKLVFIINHDYYKILIIYIYLVNNITNKNFNKKIILN